MKVKKGKIKLEMSQAIAAVGQIHLAGEFQKLFDKYKIKTGQILISPDDTEQRRRAINVRRTFDNLFKLKAIPVVNENDSTATSEIKYGDNDTLSALVALAINANKLILLTDIENLYSKDPRNNKDAQPIKEVHNSELKEIKDKNIQNSNNGWGTGGISTKLISAEIATKGGVEVQLVDGTNKKNLIEIFNDNKIGTLFYPVEKPIGNKKSWLSHAIQTVGKITLDDGASFAIKKKGASLLAVGVKNVEGNFTINQAVKIVNTNDKEVAKGLVSISSDKLRSILNNKENNNSSIIVVHRDVLALS